MLEVLAVIAIVAYVIGRQVLGEPLRGKRLLLLPAVLTVIGLTSLGSGGDTVRAADVAFLVVGAVVAAGIGAAQGSVMRLESRDGGLWGRMPPRGLWLWLALVGARIVLMLAASASGARVAASTAPIVLLLGVNRLSQAAVITRRAHAAGIAFSPEKDGSVFLADRLRQVNGRLDGLAGGNRTGSHGQRPEPRIDYPRTDSSVRSGPAGDPAAGYGNAADRNGFNGFNEFNDLTRQPDLLGDRAARRYERAVGRYDRRSGQRRYR